MLSCFAASLLLLGACAGPGGPDPQDPRPTLVVLITVDQMRADYLTRWRGQFTGGFKRLLEEGAVFTDAHQDHAITETAPGHATLLAGRFPRSTGITRNAAGVQDPRSPLIGAAGAGASPHRFRGTTLVDWLLSMDPRSRALSVSYKDRGAILPVGRSRQEVYWYAGSVFTTSRWYRDSLPDWVKFFNATGPTSYAGREWDLLLTGEEYPEPDSVPLEQRGDLPFVFPYELSSAPEVAARQVPGFPFMDELTAAFALRGTEALAIGAGPQTDVLAISFSATDLIGHRFGPDSRELHDQVLRLDRTLGAFLDSLFKIRDRNRVVLALTADHGVAPWPELNQGRITPEPMRVDILPAVEAAAQVVREAGGKPGAIDLESGALLVVRDSVGVSSGRLREAVDSFVATARRIPGVLRAERFADLARDPARQDAVARRWVQMLGSDVPVEAVVTLTPGSYWKQYPVAMHGTPHDYDSHVPLIFWGRPFQPGSYAGFVRTVDLAPTLAQVADVKPTERIDGRPLTDAIR